MEKQFLEIIHTHQKIIYKVSRMYRDGVEDREDLFQEIVYQLWKSYPDFKGDAKVSSWMYRIALNTAMAVYRKKKPTIEYGGEIPEMAYRSDESNVSENEERLFQALKFLDNGEKAIISLYLDDLNYKEISELLGISENNVGVRLNRIKAKLKKILL
jgi:RNA polymerase sigma factor (sigma-70 family)